jgi:5-methyltetrahydropteroyltriglutamate--homocysteine methyltransferase
MHFWRLGKGIDPAVYPDYHACFTDLATVYREEIAALAELGATYIQLDDVPIPMLCDPAVQDRVRNAGMDPATLMQDYLQLCNDCLKDKPDNVTVAMHMCRGNYKGRFLSEGGYETFAEAFFNTLEVDAYFLEYDSQRSGDFEPLRFVPADKTVVLGLVSSKSAIMEEPDELHRRIGAASKFIPLEQLCLSPQCGFASTVAGNPVDESIEAEKLRLVVDVAESVWR